MEQLLEMEAQVRSLEVELLESQDTMGDLEMHMEDHKAMLIEREKYTTDLEKQLPDPPPMCSAWRSECTAPRCS